MNEKKIYLKIAVITLSIGFLLVVVYRPYVYVNNINDFYFADVLSSLISVIVFCCIVWSQKTYSDDQKNKQIFISTFIYSFFWELLGWFGIWGTFDMKDIVAGLFSGVLTFFIKNIVSKNTLL